MKYFKTVFIASIVLGVSFAAPVSEEANTDNVGEYGEHFEGDMVLTDEQRETIETAVSFVTYNAVKDISFRWPSATVVYHINQADFNENQLTMIRAAMTAITSNTCVRFRERKGNEHAVVIEGTSSGCFSSVGYNKGKRQILNLGRGCFIHGKIVHEMLHTLGFLHMQSTHDRDNFVAIKKENIIEKYLSNFNKYSTDTVTDFGVTYDYGSVMHYSEYAFSKNGEKTIVPKENGAKIGQREGMSAKDISKLKKMYCQQFDAEGNKTPTR